MQSLGLRAVDLSIRTDQQVKSRSGRVQVPETDHLVPAMVNVGPLLWQGHANNSSIEKDVCNGYSDYEQEHVFVKPCVPAVLLLPPVGSVKLGTFILTQPFIQGPYQLQITLFPKASSQKQTTTHPCGTSNGIKAPGWPMTSPHWEAQSWICELHFKI